MQKPEAWHTEVGVWFALIERCHVFSAPAPELGGEVRFVRLSKHLRGRARVPAETVSRAQ